MLRRTPCSLPTGTLVIGDKRALTRACLTTSSPELIDVFTDRDRDGAAWWHFPLWQTVVEITGKLAILFVCLKLPRDKDRVVSK